MGVVYLVTGVSGHLGNVIARQLVEAGQKVRGLVLPDDPIEGRLPEQVELFTGDITNRESLRSLFSVPKGSSLRVIHSAGIISIASKAQTKLQATNVGGVKNMLTLSHEHQVEKFIYVSSVHAIPELPHGETIKEVDYFHPDLVVGPYAKTKAEATALVLRAAQDGLNATVVHPSGIVGPYDYGQGHVTQLIEEQCKGRLVASVRGGYDFVDVRDVAMGTIKACDQGRPGECYILSQGYMEIGDILAEIERITKMPKPRLILPLWLARLSAPGAEWYYYLRGLRPLYTPYSLYTLRSNGSFSHKKATAELDYRPRSFRLTLEDTIRWLQVQRRI